MRRDGTQDDLLSRPGPLALVLALLHRGPQTRQDLESIVGVQSGTIRYHVLSLEAAGIVVQSATEPIQVHLANPDLTRRQVAKRFPGWDNGGIPRGALWRQVQAAIDSRRVRATYRTHLPRPRP
jgi:hypothetical protein